MFGMKNELQSGLKPHKNSIQQQIGLEIALFLKWKNFKRIARIKFLYFFKTS